MLIDTDFAFNRYQQIRHRLPEAEFPNESVQISGLLALVDEIDVFLFDAFGVLNVGESCVEGAPQVVAALQSMGKNTFVVTNAGSVEKSRLLIKYAQLGYRFDETQVITSRDQLAVGLEAVSAQKSWGVAAPIWSAVDTIGSNLTLLHDDLAAYDAVDGFIFLGSHGWSPERQDLMLISLAANPRPLLVGNPDLIAPRENGFTLEPGFYAHDIADKTMVKPEFFGKPFAHVFSQVKVLVNNLNPDRTIMIGDTLHTDILGGAAAGFKTALVTDHGLFRGHDVEKFIQQSAIIPDYILSSI